MHTRRFTYLAGIVVVGMMLCHTAQVCAEGGEQVLKFPEDRVVGRVYIRDVDDDSHWINCGDEGYDRVVNAVGTVVLSADEVARLDLNVQAVTAPEFLDAIDPGAIRCITMFRTGATDDVLPHVMRFDQLRYVALGGTSVTDAGVAKVCALPHLEGLDLSLTPITDAALAHVAQVAGLDYLSIGGAEVSPAALAHLQNLTHLRELNVSQCPVDDTWLEEIGKITSLETLTMWRFPVIDADLSHLAGLTKLRVLDVSGLNIDKAGIRELAAFASLESLTGRAAGLEAEDAMVIARVKTLKTLVLHGAPYTPAVLAELAKLPVLEQTNLSGPELTDEGLKELAKSTSLKQLWLQNAKITNDGIAALAPMHQLEHLLLFRLDINGDCLQVVGNFPNLVWLSVSSDADPAIDLSPIAQLKNLEYLDLHMPSLTDSGMAAVASLTKLKRLRVDGAVLTDASLKHIAGLAQLQQLSLVNATMTDAALITFSELSDLQSLQVGGDFTDGGVAQLAKLQRLYSLYLRTASVSMDAMDRLKADLPNLAIAQVQNPTVVEPIKVGAPLPDIAAVSTDDEAINLHDHRGKVIFVHFWATWCGPCMASMPTIVAAQEKLTPYAEDYFTVSFNMDANSSGSETDMARAKRTMQKQGITWPQVVQPAGVNAAIEAFGVRGIPTYIIIGVDGQVAYVGHDFTQAHALLDSAVKAASIARTLREQMPGDAASLIAAHAKMVEAARAGDVAAVDALLKDHAALDRPAWLPFGEAVDADQDAVARLLIEHGADADIWQAARLGLVDIVKAKLDADATLLDASQNATGPTPLGAAAHRNRVEVMKLLLERGADVNAPSGGATRNTPLHWAAEDAVEAVTLLLARGADTKALNNWGSTPLAVARWAVDAKLTTPERGDRIIALLEAHAAGE